MLEGYLNVRGPELLASASSDYVCAARAKVDDAYRLAGYILGDATDAQDAVQDALMKAWQNWSKLREPASFGPWFERIVVNCCRDRMRRHRTLRMVDIGAAGDVESPDTFVAMVEQDRVAGAVARLEPNHRIVIALRYWRDLSLEQVAETLDLPLGTVKSRLHYALRALRDELGGSIDEA
jgi:RNA polymerase sigma-70 factor (ECF subfamily)